MYARLYILKQKNENPSKSQDTMLEDYLDSIFHCNNVFFYNLDDNKVFYVPPNILSLIKEMISK